MCIRDRFKLFFPYGPPTNFPWYHKCIRIGLASDPEELITISENKEIIISFNDVPLGANKVFIDISDFNEVIDLSNTCEVLTKDFYLN